jgi:flagellar hook-basal body complex protein FliE
MTDPLSIQSLTSRAVQPGQAQGPAGQPGRVEGKDFKSFLVESLEKASELQTDADQAIQQLMTGQTQNVAEVFTTVRKAEIAFGLLMEIRNKLLDAYQEIRQMQV